MLLSGNAHLPWCHKKEDYEEQPFPIYFAAGHEFYTCEGAHERREPHFSHRYYRV